MDERARAPGRPTERPRRARTEARLEEHPLLRLQREAGNSAVAGIAAEGRATIQRQGRPAESRRERAARLGSPDARLFLAVQLPAVLAQLGAEQIAQIQKVLDSTVVNPDAQKRSGELERSATKSYGSLEVKDKKIEHQAEAAAQEAIHLEPSDWRIRLDPTPLVAPDVFDVKAVNKEEAAFMTTAREVLAHRGLWLRLGMGFRIGTDEDGNRATLPTPETWLSLGPEGEDSIPAPLGYVTRDALLSTRAIALLHYKTVDKSPRRVRLDGEARRVFNMLQDGQQNHLEDRRIRNAAAPGVPQVADWLGDADFPDPAIWDAPWKLFFRANEKLAAGDVELALRPLIGAALLGKRASLLVHEYEAHTVAGAEMAVKWLNRVKVASEIVGAVLAVATGVGALGLLEGGAETTGALAADEMVAAEGAMDAAEASNMDEYLTKLGSEDAEFSDQFLYQEMKVSRTAGGAGNASRGMPKNRPGGSWGTGMGGRFGEWL